MCVCVFSENQIPAGFPSIDMGPQLKVVERTRIATMLCAASGNPDPEISWFKDFLPVDINSSSGRIKQLRSGTGSNRTAAHDVPVCTGLTPVSSRAFEYYLFTYYNITSRDNLSGCTAPDGRRR